MTKTRHIYFGPPGTGKTTTLLAEVASSLDAGIPLDRIGFVSFSRRAISEATDRLKEITTATPIHFRTIHSTAYRLADLSPGDVLQREHLDDFGERIGVPFGRKSDPTQVLWEGALGDKCLALYDLARSRNSDLETEWRRADVGDLSWELLSRTIVQYERYKTANALWDFHDMIEKATGTLDLDRLFIDEAQDNSLSQWAFLRRIASGVRDVVFAGDDDQAIYGWSGADPASLLRLNAERTVLPKSYRLPRSIKRIADTIVNRIHYRVPKTFASRDDEGRVEWINDISEIDLHEKGSWLLLARSNYQLKEFRSEARRQGVVYLLDDGTWSWTIPAIRAARAYETLRKKDGVVLRADVREMNRFLRERIRLPKETMRWEDVWTNEGRESRTWMDALPAISDRDREYIRALRRSGESLTEPGRVRIGTVHSAKGAEADHVVLSTDISERVAASARVDPDSEARVQYVAATRARSRLLLLRPATATFWDF